MKKYVIYVLVTLAAFLYIWYFNYSCDTERVCDGSKPCTAKTICNMDGECKTEAVCGYIVNRGFFQVILILLFWSASQATLWWGRYRMPVMVSNGAHGSILGEPRRIQDRNGTVWCIFNTGESLEPVHIRGKLSTIIVPETQLNKMKDNFVCKTLTKKYHVNWLPENVSTYLKRSGDRYNLNNIYFGYHAEKLNHVDVRMIADDAEVEHRESDINLRNDSLEGRYDHILEAKTLAKKLVGSDNAFMNIFRRKKQENDEEKN